MFKSILCYWFSRIRKSVFDESRSVRFEHPRFRFKRFMKRLVLSSVVLASLVVACVLIGGWL